MAIMIVPFPPRAGPRHGELGQMKCRTDQVLGQRGQVVRRKFKPRGVLEFAGEE